MIDLQAEEKDLFHYFLYHTDLIFQDVAATFKEFNGKVSGQESLIIVPYIKEIKSPDGLRELLLGIQIGSSKKAEISIGTYMVKRQSPEAELNYGLKIFARTEKADVEIGGIELQIFENRKIVIYAWQNEDLGKIQTIDINQISASLHRRIDSNGVFVRNLVQNLTKSITVSSNLAQNLEKVSRSSKKQVEFAQATLHHYLDIGIELVKNSNPTQAVTKKGFYLKDIINGQIEKVVNSALQGANNAQKMAETVNFKIPGLDYNFGDIIGLSHTTWDEISGVLETLYYCNDHEFYIALPLALPADVPKDFDLKQVIMESDIMKSVIEAANVKFWINQVEIIISQYFNKSFECVHYREKGFFFHNFLFFLVVRPESCTLKTLSNTLLCHCHNRKWTPRDYF